MSYLISSLHSAQYPPTEETVSTVWSLTDRQEFSTSLKVTALRLNCIAKLIELYEMPGGLEEAVQVLESIANFYTDHPSSK